MDKALKARLIGAAVLVALAVLLIPELLSGRKSGNAGDEVAAVSPGTRTFTIELAGSGPPPPAKVGVRLDLERCAHPTTGDRPGERDTGCSGGLRTCLPAGRQVGRSSASARCGRALHPRRSLQRPKRRRIRRKLLPARRARRMGGAGRGVQHCRKGRQAGGGAQVGGVPGVRFAGFEVRQDAAARSRRARGRSFPRRGPRCQVESARPARDRGRKRLTMLW